jgi:hypothetical protein
MASGKIHDRAIYFATPVVGICIGYYLSPMLGLIAASSHLLGGLYLSPDLDLKEPTLEALGHPAYHLATLSENPTSALAESCPRCWLNRSVAVSRRVCCASKANRTSQALAHPLQNGSEFWYTLHLSW